MANRALVVVLVGLCALGVGALGAACSGSSSGAATGVAGSGSAGETASTGEGGAPGSAGTSSGAGTTSTPMPMPGWECTGPARDCSCQHVDAQKPGPAPACGVPGETFCCDTDLGDFHNCSCSEAMQWQC